jgi:multiple sugar transport system ATP-binding protein
MARVVVDHLHVWYGKTHAADDISLTVDDGEFCVFLGPSGCGKTTTLRAIAGLLKPDAGDILIDEQVITRLYPGERDIAMVFQSYALYPHLTVAKHLAFPLEAKKMDKATIAAETQRIAELLGLADVLERLPRYLSTGQAQRVAIGRALIRKPRVLLLDEPLNNLDVRLKLQTRAVLKRLQRDLDITTIYVTHDQEEAQSLADTIVVMDNGRIQQSGSPMHIYDQPINEFVAGFIGTPPMNFMRCKVERARGHGTYLLGPDGFELRAEDVLAAHMGDLPDDSEVTIGIRPERIALQTEPDESLPLGHVHIVEPEGNDLIISVRVGNAIWKVRATKAQFGGRLQRDIPVNLRIDQAKLHLFAPDTGQRIELVKQANLTP